MPEPTRLVPSTVWYLEMASPADLRPRPGAAEIRRSNVPLGALSRFFYVEVGRDVDWLDRIDWPAGRWQEWAERTELWIAYDGGTPAGYAELLPREDGTVDVAYFGVLPPFRGRGIGAQLLTRVVERAWELGPDRVTVNTCDLDGPYARAHYEARGFRVVREAVEDRRVGA